MPQQKIWNGTAWIENNNEHNVYNGSAFTKGIPKIWNGTSWVEVISTMLKGTVERSFSAIAAESDLDFKNGYLWIAHQAGGYGDNSGFYKFNSTGTLLQKIASSNSYHNGLATDGINYIWSTSGGTTGDDYYTRVAKFNLNGTLITEVTQTNTGYTTILSYRPDNSLLYMPVQRNTRLWKFNLNCAYVGYEQGYKYTTGDILYGMAYDKGGYWYTSGSKHPNQVLNYTTGNDLTELTITLPNNTLFLAYDNTSKRLYTNVLGSGTIYVYK